ncbi:M56 family metallopeptidase [Prosthecobacter sp.]|uniref:M56 family metallopeptidase n=1 Tax=Prosthecobacter sp. TaxID=1965333 RepID=UPI003BAFA476
MVHSLVIGAAAWLLVRFVIRDALRRCILTNLAVLMCLYTPFDIRVQDLLPKKEESVPVWTPIRETFKADWRVSVAPAKAPEINITAEKRAWDVNEMVKVLRWLFWLVTAALWVRLLYQSVRVQRWAWRLRQPTSIEYDKLPEDLKRERVRVFDQEGTPCVAGWFFPVIAMPASAFEKLTARQWRWLLRHEVEHLRLHDTVVVLLQNIVRAFLWWNPFVHALVEEYARAREEACDAAAVGEGRDHTAYADFLLAWAGRSAPQQNCVMAIAYSRPAKRLKVRLVVLMEARGVRKKLGALFVLGCLAFAVVAPVIAASFGIATTATAAAQEVVKTKADDGGVMYMRVYRVTPDFLNGDAVTKAPVPEFIGKSARQLLEERGIPFPEGAFVMYNPATSQLRVRHYKAAHHQIETIIDDLSRRSPLVYVQCKLIQAESYYGMHGGILGADEVQQMWGQLLQKKGIDLATLPSITGKLGLEAIAEVVQEVFPGKITEANAKNALKLIGPSIKVTASSTANGKALVAAKVSLGVDPDGSHPWLPQKGDKPVWERVQIHTAAAQAELGSGETLVMHLPTSKKHVTVLITVEALNPKGQKAPSFEATAVIKPSITGIDVPDKAAREWAVRVYQVPADFPRDKPPVEVLKEAGFTFPKPADAELKDGKLTVRNTKPILDLIEAWIDFQRATAKKIVVTTVHAVEIKGDFLKLLRDWIPVPPSDQKPAATMDPPPLSIAAASPTEDVLRQFTVAGVFTSAQYATVLQRMSGVADYHMKLEVLKPKGDPASKPQAYVLPAFMGGSGMTVEAQIGGDGNTLNFTVSNDPNMTRRFSTGLSVWDGQTFVMAAQPTEGVSRLLFITGQMIARPIKEEEKKK